MTATSVIVIARRITAGARGVGTPSLPSNAWFNFPLDEGSGVIAKNRAVADIAYNDIAGTPEQLCSYGAVNPSGTITDFAGTAPDGSNNASRWTATSGGIRLLGLPCNTQPPGTYTISFYARSASGSQDIHVSYDDGITKTTPVVSIGETWTRYEATFVVTTGLTGLNIANDDSSAVDLFLWGLLVEPGSTASTYPVLDWHGFVKAPVWITEGLNFSSTWMVGVSASRPKTLTAATFYFAVKKTVTHDYSPIFSSSLGVPPELHLFSSYGGTGVGFNAGGIGLHYGKVRADDGNWHIIALACDGSTAKLFMDSTQILKATGTMGSLTVDRFYISNINNIGTLEFGGQIAYCLGYDSAHDTETIRATTNLIQDLIAPRGIAAVDLPELLIFEGDSITAAATDTQLSPTVKFVNVAVGGSTLANLVSRSDNVKEYHRPGQNTILRVMIGANDLLSFGAATYFPMLKAYTDDMQAFGMKVVVCTNTPINNASFETERQALATLIRADNDFEAVIDFADDPDYGQFANAADTDKYPDGLHPTTTVQNAMEVASSGVLQSLL